MTMKHDSAPMTPDAGPVTGRLENWRRLPTAIGDIVFGDVFEDAKGRFPDGSTIRTSPVVSTTGDLLFTTYSIYRLGKEVPDRLTPHWVEDWVRWHAR